MTLAEIEAILGPARTASSVQSERLNGFFPRFPSQVRAAQSDKGTDRGWGNSQAWLAAQNHRGWSRVARDHAIRRCSATRRTRAPKVYFRDISKPREDHDE